MLWKDDVYVFYAYRYIPFSLGNQHSSDIYDTVCIYKTIDQALTIQIKFIPTMHEYIMNQYYRKYEHDCNIMPFFPQQNLQGIIDYLGIIKYSNRDSAA